MQAGQPLGAGSSCPLPYQHQDRPSSGKIIVSADIVLWGGGVPSRPAHQETPDEAEQDVEIMDMSPESQGWAADTCVMILRSLTTQVLKGKMRMSLG